MYYCISLLPFLRYYSRMGRPRTSHGPTVKTTVDLPQHLWRAAKIRAMDDHTDLRSVIVAALEAFVGRREEDGASTANSESQ